MQFSIEEETNLNFNKKESKTLICNYQPSLGWKKQFELIKRDPIIIYYNDEKKKQILTDVYNFYVNEEKYQKLGIPYKRIYCLYGIPSSGKNSLAYAIAFLFNKNIGLVTFNKELNDMEFMKALQSIQDETILLIKNSDEYSKSFVTLNFFLNFLEGNIAKEGLVVFLTTNNYNNIEAAFKRPGRIDYIMEFEDITKDFLFEIFI